MGRQLLMLIVPTQGQPTQSRLSGTSGTEGMPHLAFATATGCASGKKPVGKRSEEHTSELQSRGHLVCRLLLEKKKSVISLTTDYNKYAERADYRIDEEHC